MAHFDQIEYNRAYRKRRKELHLCEKCGKQDAYTLAGRCRCRACSDRDNARRRAKRSEDQELRARDIRDKKENYSWMKRHHYCVSCKAVDAYTLAGRPLCARCAAKKAADEREKKARTNLRERRQRNQRRRKERWKEAGRCASCGKPLPSKAYPYLTCERCRAKDRERRRLKREKAGGVSRSEYKELGLCVTCGRPRVKDKTGWDGKEILLCERCYANALKWAEAGRKAFEEKHGMTYRSWATGNEFNSMKARRSRKNGPKPGAIANGGSHDQQAL